MFKFSDSTAFLLQFKKGDPIALERVYFAYVDEVATYVRRFCAIRARLEPAARLDDVGDLIQEVFARAFGDKARWSFDGSREYGPFLGTLSRNLLIGMVRRSGREIPSDELDRLPQMTSLESNHWADQETMDAVNAYIAELPADLRQVHESRYVECQSQEQACARLGITRQTLRTREKHLRDGLRRRLKRLEIEQRRDRRTMSQPTLEKADS